MLFHNPRGVLPAPPNKVQKPTFPRSKHHMGCQTCAHMCATWSLPPWSCNCTMHPSRSPQAGAPIRLCGAPIRQAVCMAAIRRLNRSWKREVSVEQLRIPFIKPPAPPSEVSSQVLDDEDQPQSKKRRGQYEEPWQCYRCLTVCGNLSKRCQVPIKELSPPALLGAWLRLAHKGRSDVRQEYPALTEELKARGLVAPPDKSQGERMLQDLKKALRLGSRIPPEWLLSTVSVEEVVEAPVTPMTPPPSPALPASSTTETEQEFRSRVQVVLDALRNSGTSPEVEAQVLASLTKKP